jgi:acid stress-induced BolA-like protein IbaG/YrbA
MPLPWFRQDSQRRDLTVFILICRLILMLSNKEVEEKLKSNSEVYLVQVNGNGYQYEVTVVSDIFVNKSKVARQQWVYAQLNEFITTGKLHAITMKTWTKEEWGKQNG